ncbi:MAG: putative Ig domain-containing protein [Trebonia sp.]
MGSENLTSNSLNGNRELGLITSDSGVVGGLESTFDGDFTGSAAGQVSIISPGSMRSAVGATVDYQVQADDTCTGSLSYSASGLPAGLSISSSTGVISGTVSTAGTYSVTLTGKDSTGPSGSATVLRLRRAATAGQRRFRDRCHIAVDGLIRGARQQQFRTPGAGRRLPRLDRRLQQGTHGHARADGHHPLHVRERGANLGAHIGQSITIKFIGTEVSGGNTQFLEDSNALNVS